ncbi:MAG: tRNA pseudouridine(38-40) synthase TruA [Lentisphaerae bacterium]|nr:MAG: tRNA pseudouridine(38-40) synthase TruA [Lentisphaerota bacterium]
MPKYLLRLAFVGSRYAGWQYQPDQATVEAELKQVLAKLYPEGGVTIQGASRTDAGVHALDLCAAVTVPETPPIPPNGLQHAITNMLPASVTLHSLEVVPAEFNVHGNRGKAYCYLLNRGKFSPFLHPYTWHQPELNHWDAMEEAGKAFVGEHDFLAFTVGFERQNRENSVRTIYSLSFQDWGDIVGITICGNGFLYRMVRRIVGFLVAVGNGRLSPVMARELLLHGPKQSIQFNTAPSRGLFLVRTFFEEDPERFQITTPPFMADLNLELG